MKIVAGIDVSKLTLDAFSKGENRSFSNDAAGHGELREWLRRHGAELAVMEATGAHHYELACHLAQSGQAVAVVNPARALWHAKSRGLRNKTDKVDARVLAQMGADQEDLKLFQAPSESQRSLTQLVRLRQSVVVSASRAQTRLKEPALDDIEIRILRQQWELFATQIRAIEESIRKLVRDHPDLAAAKDLLTSIPGVGEITAWSMLGEMGDLRRFDSPKQVAAFAGVCPSVRESGTSLRKSSMVRAGNRQVRKALYMAALSAIRGEGAFRNLYSRLLAKGRARKSALVAVMHKLIRVAYGVLKSGCRFKEEPTLTTA